MSKWTDSELAQLCNRYPFERAASIAKDLRRPLSTVYAKANSMGLRKSREFFTGPHSGRTNLDKHRSPKWTDEQLEILHTRYPHEKTAFVAAALGRTVNSCYARARLEGLGKTAAFLATPDSGRTNGTKGMSSRFLPGHIPANKGKKGMVMHPNIIATQFKKGQTPINEMPVGSYRQTTKERYWCKKVQMHGTQRERWPELHKLVWVEHNGPIPPKHIIRFKDGNPGDRPEDVVIDNLECISMAENCLRNSIHNLPKPVVEAIQQRGRLTREINKQRRAHEEQHR